MAIAATSSSGDCDQEQSRSWDSLIKPLISLLRESEELLSMPRDVCVSDVSVSSDFIGADKCQISASCGSTPSNMSRLDEEGVVESLTMALVVVSSSLSCLCPEMSRQLVREREESASTSSSFSGSSKRSRV